MHIHKKRVVLIADAKASDTFLAVCDGKLEWVQGASVPANHSAQWVIRKSGKSNIVRNRQESALFLSGNGNHHLILSKMHDGVNSLSIIQCSEAGGAKQFQFSVTPDVGDENPTYTPLQVKSPSGATMVTKFTFSSQAFAQDSVAQPSETPKKMSPGMIAGIVIVSLVALALIIAGIWFMVTSRNFRLRQGSVAEEVAAAPSLPAPNPPAPTLPINGPINGAAPTSLFDFFE